MDNIELENIWKSHNQKLDSVLALNKVIAIDLARQKLKNQINLLLAPKWFALIIGIPYTLVLIAVFIFATIAKAVFVAIGFGGIAVVMMILIVHYIYQLYLIQQVKKENEVLSTQEHLSKLKISSFNSLNIAVFQIPFWSVCWISLDAILESPLIYGGINLLVFLAFSYFAYWLYQKISYKHKDSKVRDFLLAGREWEPILKSSDILEQIKEFEVNSIK